MSATRIVELSSRIASNTTKLNDYFVSNGLPTPSLDFGAPATLPIGKDAPEIEAARLGIIEDTAELRRLMLGPRGVLMKDPSELLPQQAIVRFRLAHAIPVGGEATFAEIAATVGLSEADVRQIIRFAIMQDMFCEPRPGVIAHNAASRLLVEDQVVYDRVGATCDDLWQASSRTCDAMEKYPHSEEPNETGFAVANGTTESMYEFFTRHPERARRFENAMRSFVQTPAYDVRHVADNYPWGDHGSGTIVDVGGSHGLICFAIARKFPDLTFVVQDLEPVIATAQEQAPKDLVGRVRFEVHDFLMEQPNRGADVYFFRWIFHNWSDKYCVKILRNLIPALKPGAKVIVNDSMLPPPGLLPRELERGIRSMDMSMKMIQNARERELDDWIKLFAKADERFTFQSAQKPEGSNLSILVFEWTAT